METNESTKNFEQHIFVCTQCQYVCSNGKACGPDIAPAFRKSLKSKVKTQFPEKNIRVNSSGCLGQCEQGISAVIYPQGEWELNLRPGEEERLIQHIK